jgi:hypothetical protein
MAAMQDDVLAGFLGIAANVGIFAVAAGIFSIGLAFTVRTRLQEQWRLLRQPQVPQQEMPRQELARRGMGAARRRLVSGTRRG